MKLPSKMIQVPVESDDTHVSTAAPAYSALAKHRSSSGTSERFG